MNPLEHKHHLFIIVIAQFACTSLWFAGNAILPDLQTDFHLPDRALGDLTSAVQFGFIIGTLIFALLTISDRYSPSKVFFICAFAGALINFSITLISTPILLFFFRGMVGFFLAGIYPVGMKIASDYNEKGLGKALGYLVGALVLGTAFPHLIKMFSVSLDWRTVIYTTSIMAISGGCAIYFFVPDGPFRRIGSKVDLTLFLSVFKEKKFRSAAFGYFGHMWELYTLWAFIPFMIIFYNNTNGETINVGLWSFVIIGSGSLSCVLGGYASKYFGSRNIAFVALLTSGACCVLSFFFFQLPSLIFILSLVIWGMAVIADSPQFSTLIAQYAPAEARGTALTIVNSIGFAITIVSLQVMNQLIAKFDPQVVFVSLAIGPLLGLLALGQSKATV